MEPQVGMYIRWESGSEDGVVFKLLSYIPESDDDDPAFNALVISIPASTEKYVNYVVGDKVDIYIDWCPDNYAVLDSFDFMVKELRKEAGCE